GFFLYRTLLVATTLLCAFASRKRDLAASNLFLRLIGAWVALTLISIARIQGSHFDAFSIFYTHVLFIAACLTLSQFNRDASARWKGVLLALLVAVNVAHLLPDLIRAHRPIAGFSLNNPDYFGTFMLIGLAASLAITVFGTNLLSRAVTGTAAALLFFG